MSFRLYRFALAVLLLGGICVQAPAAVFELGGSPVADRELSRALYQPIMELLSRETGETFVYVHSDTPIEYRAAMQSGRFHLAWDDAHFASWRIDMRNHAPLVRINRETRFVAIVAKNGIIFSKEDLVGRTVCGPAPPALATLAFLGKFDGLFQVPRIQPSADPLDRVQNLLIGRCDAALLARHVYAGSTEIRGVAGQLRIVTETDAFPGATLTAAPDVPAELRAQIRAVLLSRSGGRATRALRERLAAGSSLVEAEPEDYDGLHERLLLRDYPGFSE
ncbi:MAG TPA: PhnD/SsuA/transferrin family substrate-binding protein [Arenicellales bacterium]|nr:PhnD/SsuA/transferrin family substrate-binding protein [Arenicellales bacterium]